MSMYDNFSVGFSTYRRKREAIEEASNSLRKHQSLCPNYFANLPCKQCDRLDFNLYFARQYDAF